MIRKHRGKRLALALETIQLLVLDRVSGGGVGEHPTSRETLPTGLPSERSCRVTQCVSATCP